MDQVPSRAFRPFRLLLGLLYASMLGTFLYFLAAGASYYGTPLVERPRHPDYWTFKPGGRLGLAFGVAGTTMMTVMHAYSARKRIRVFRRLGPLARWLDVHILLGIGGPLFIVLHTSFKVGGLAAISFWSMVAVAASGVFGRYLYVQIPRTRAGEALSLKEVEAADQALSTRLRDEFGIDEAQIASFQKLATPAWEGAGLLRVVLGGLLEDVSRARMRQARAFARECPSVPPSLFRALVGLLREMAVLRRRLALWERLQRAFHYWHVVHKPFAIVMYVFLVVHVAVVSWAGYGWPR